MKDGKSWVEKMTEQGNIQRRAYSRPQSTSNSGLCYKVMGKDSTGRTAWYFILLDNAKKDAFLRHKQGDSYNLADYGEILVSGYGEEVPDDVKEMLTEKYGFDDF